MMRRSSRAWVAALSMAFVVLGAAPAFAYGSTGPALSGNATSVPVDSPMTLTWTGFQDNELVGNVAHSNSVVLPTVRADASGNFIETVRLPPSLGPGAHQIVATGLTSGKVATFDFTVTGTAASEGTGLGSGSPSSPLAFTSPTAGSGLGSSTPTSPLAFTGADVALLCAVAAAALAVGGFLVLASRRRSHSHRSV